MREHIRAAQAEAERLGGRCEWEPWRGHGRLHVIAPDGRETRLVCGWAPKGASKGGKQLCHKVKKFIQNGKKP